MNRAFRAMYWLTPIVFCLALYWLGLRTWFSQDDFAWLGLRLQVHDFPSFLDAMFAPKAQGTIRPLSERGFFMLFSYFFGLHALPYRLFIFCNQCLNIILLMLVTLKLTRSQLATLIAPLLWLANIALITPMAWTSAYNEIQCASFLLISFYLFLLYVETGLRRFYWAQWLTFLLGFGALEINFVYPVLAALYALLLARRYFRATWPMLGVSAVYVIVDRVAGTGSSTQETNYFYELSFNVKALIATLVQYWTDLLGVTAYAHQRQWPDWIGTLSILLFAVVLVGYVARQSWKRNFLPLFLMGWFLIVLGPLLPLHNHVSDYYLFVPTIGLAILAAYGISSAWQQGWISVAAVAILLSPYLVTSIGMIRIGMRSNYQRGDQARVLVQSVAYAKKIHPGKVILLKGIDDNLFWAAIYDSPFHILGWNDVFVTAESRWQIYDPHFNDIDRYFLPRNATLSLLKDAGAVVYDVGNRQLRNVTGIYSVWELSQPPPALDPFIDVGVPFYSDQLGQGWYAQESGFRWASQHAVVYLPGPASAIEKLHIHGFVSADMVKPGPLHLALTINGRPEPMETISSANTDFIFSYDIPPDFIGQPKMEIALNVDRATTVLGDQRLLGLAFGTFAIR